MVCFDWLLAYLHYIETYEKLVDKFELYKLLDQGLEVVKNNKVMPAEKALEKIEGGLPGCSGVLLAEGR